MKEIKVQIYETTEKLPEHGVMILADDGSEWVILLAEGTDTACPCEDPTRVTFKRWLYLGDLDNEEENT